MIAAPLVRTAAPLLRTAAAAVRQRRHRNRHRNRKPRRVWVWAGLVAATGGMFGLLLVAAAASDNQAPEPDGPGGPVEGIPPVVLAAYRDAAQTTPDLAPACRGMRWPVLAGIGRVESSHTAGHTVTPDGLVQPRIVGPALDGHGTLKVPDTDQGRWDGDTTWDRAVGPMQFIPASWRRYGRDGNYDGQKNPNNVFDAAHAAVVHLCGTRPVDLTDRSQLRKALYGYNPSDSYVARVLGFIDTYDTLNDGEQAPPTGGNGARMLAAAKHWTGTPYSWAGGNQDGPSRGVCCSPGGQDGSQITGFDCSGLTLYALAQINVSGVAHSATWQYHNAPRLGGTHIPKSAGLDALKPGDLLFFNGGSSGGLDYLHHVGLYAGKKNGQHLMLNAARPGTRVRIEPIWDDYAAAARWT